MALQNMIPTQGEERGKVISYGSCQFPTLGFVVDRYLRVRNFVPEPFWYVRVAHRKNDIEVRFNWRRGHLFDRMTVIIIFERCLLAKIAKVIKMSKKPTRKWKPLPLTTVELQKNGSRFLRITSQEVMKVAEDLYTKGWISYPRTETDQFDHGMDLRALVGRQTQDNSWGPFAQHLLNGGFSQPRMGRNNDKAHPPIHPVNYVAPTQLNQNERRVYEFIVRRFLACCSEDAVGEATDIEVDYGGEVFHAHGLRVIARNYLDVYPYDKWESSQQLPEYAVGETFEPTEVNMHDGQTSAPTYLTEPELIALMDANGIGTDATMAEHIAKVQEREYVIARPKGGGAPANGGNGGGRGRGRGGARGGRGGRGGATAHNGGGGGTGGIQEFIPTTLGVALIEGYDNVGFETSLSKPFLRKEVSASMLAVVMRNTEASLTLSVDGGSDEGYLRRPQHTPRRGPAESRAVPCRVQSHSTADQCAQICMSIFPTLNCVGHDAYVRYSRLYESTSWAKRIMAEAFCTHSDGDVPSRRRRMPLTSTRHARSEIGGWNSGLRPRAR
jgi:DNA topoisomerase-3